MKSIYSTKMLHERVSMKNLLGLSGFFYQLVWDRLFNAFGYKFLRLIILVKVPLRVLNTDADLSPVNRHTGQNVNAMKKSTSLVCKIANAIRLNASI